MSKYTTEVRFICEQKSGLTESKGYNEVSHIIDESWNKIFKSNEWDIYDEAYRPVLCKKILKHFYTREIGAETAGLWEMWLNQRMSEIMPYYNQLYKSTLLEFNPLYDVDYRTEGDKTDNGRENSTENIDRDNTRTDNLSSLQTDNRNSLQTNNLTHNNTGGRTGYDVYSDTPQGALTGVENENYLTNARKTTDNHNDTDHDTGTINIANTGTTKVDNTGTQTNVGNEDKIGNKLFTNTGEYTEHVFGKRSSVTYSKMITEFRDSMLNIDMMIIEELNDLFLNLW